MEGGLRGRTESDTDYSNLFTFEVGLGTNSTLVEYDLPSAVTANLCD